jgi:hypothetical protein
MGVKVSGIEALIAALSQTGQKAERGVADVMRKGAKEIQDLARRQAPRDTGNLEKAIKVEEDRSGKNGRVQVYVYVDGSEADENGRPIDEYAMQMHEGQYNLGDKSRAKQAADAGAIVGNKFLERAVDKIGPSLTRKVSDAVKETLE